MGRQFVIFVDENLVAGSVQIAAANAGFASGLGSAVPSASQSLELRRGVLNSLAQGIAGGPIGGGLAGMAINALAEPAAAGRSAEAGPGTQVLEGASAIVVDGDQVDVASLEGVIGLTVVPNVQLKLPEPVLVQSAAAPNDWHLRQIGLAAGMRGGADILIGILDTGVDAGHAEFGGRVRHFAEFDSMGRLISRTPRDAGEHGTHVSSIAAGAQAGVAPDAELAVAAVLTHRNERNEMEGSLVQIVNGFNWLVTTRFRGNTPGVDIVNASLGGGGFNRFLQPPVQTAFALGIPLLAAIGNAGRSGGGRHGSPGNYPEVLSVGATDDRDVVAVFSDWGVGSPPAGPKYPVPELSAPGDLVHAAKPGGGFQAMSGTSMATPVVTGVAARRMAANRALIGQPAALFVELRRMLAPVNANPAGNLGGAGRIVA